ncbi:hypothetical protein F5Y15DRAFT_374844, partial [Xylariaceae sp. FL0016]
MHGQIAEAINGTEESAPDMDKAREIASKQIHSMHSHVDSETKEIRKVVNQLTKIRYTRTGFMFTVASTIGAAIYGWYFKRDMANNAARFAEALTAHYSDLNTLLETATDKTIPDMTGSFRPEDAIELIREIRKIRIGKKRLRFYSIWIFP